ncbi:MAG: hypothetical protein JWO82_248 [Akkermansiaceae bacterium]|nr:hypothetical protein [Akkermansiaceae bacterium]
MKFPLRITLAAIGLYALLSLTSCGTIPPGSTLTYNPRTGTWTATAPELVEPVK